MQVRLATMASHIAASAFGHCLALVREEEEATRLAVVAVRRGGPSLGAVLGHARHQAVAAAEAAPDDEAALDPDAGPAEVAWALARTRPPLELALVDLGGRYRLGRAGLGIALRSTPAAAAARVAAVGRRWDAELDPALLAWSGPGECEDLAGILAGIDIAPAGLLAVAGEVADHTDGCPACADRRRAMPSVRHLLAATPLPSPPVQVVAAASGSRLQPPVPPPPLEPGSRRRGLQPAAAAVAALVVAGLIGVAVLSAGDNGDAAASVQALTRLPLAAGSLQLAPSDLEPSAGEVSLANASGAPVSWEAAADAPWLAVSPDAGRLEPGTEQVLRLEGSPPEGDVRASLRVTGDDGSTAMAAVAGTVERPPDLGAVADGCTVTADVEDEGDVALTLHWRDAAGDHSASMSAPAEGKSTGGLPPATPLTWWVNAVDGRGNQARTADVQLSGGC